MAKELKQLMAQEVRSDLEAACNVLVVGIESMDAAKTHALRTTLRNAGARLRVIHNRTCRFALEEARKGLGEYFLGPTALTLVPDEESDIVSIAKTLVDAQRQKSIRVRGAWVDGELLDRKGVEILAAIPDKKTLRGMLCSAILGPARGIAVSLQAVGGGLARCLQARIDQSTDSQTEE